MAIMMVPTSHDQLSSTGLMTGFWLEEGAAPYFVFRGAGVKLTLASPKGGQPSIDSKSARPDNQTPAQARFKKDEQAQKDFANTVLIADVKSENFDTIFYPGGYGPMWDLSEDPVSIALLESFYNSGKPISLVCHSPGVLRHVKCNGEPLVKEKHVTGFTNGKEELMKLTHVVPFLVEDDHHRRPLDYRTESRILDDYGANCFEFPGRGKGSKIPSGSRGVRKMIREWRAGSYGWQWGLASWASWTRRGSQCRHFSLT